MDLRTDYPRRVRVFGGRVTHAIPAKGKLVHDRWGQRHIEARTACGKTVEMTRSHPARGDVLDPGSEVTCTKCHRIVKES